MPQPLHPKIYHILPVGRLPFVVASGGLLSHAGVNARGGGGVSVGMEEIKSRRLIKRVAELGGRCVGECVPFYFCSRSCMLYVLHKANHPGLTYREGQDLIVHLECDLRSVVAWADGQGGRWAFSLGNASTNFAEFRTSLDDLKEINWTAVQSRWFNDPETKEGKQAEFLIEDFLPWSLVERIGVRDRSVATSAANAIAGAAHRPVVEIKPDWYF